jgi:hypothetical protein
MVRFVSTLAFTQNKAVFARSLALTINRTMITRAHRVQTDPLDCEELREPIGLASCA